MTPDQEHEIAEEEEQQEIEKYEEQTAEYDEREKQVVLLLSFALNGDKEGSTLEDTEKETEERTTELETVEEISEGDFERDSYQGYREEDSERERDQEDDQEKELEMLQPTLEPEEFLTPEQREERRMEQTKMDKKQKIVHWNNIWPWGDHLGRRIYRDSNTHLVASKVIETKKINFLKYQPPPQILVGTRYGTTGQFRQSKAMIQKNLQDVAPQTKG
ncbi:hypothetical protein CBL_05952 [Carabus blaptoides fortunei]